MTECWEQRMAERAFSRSLITAAQRPDPEPAQVDPSDIAAWLDHGDMSEQEAGDVLNGRGPVTACACVGNPWTVPGAPCYCELATMKAQQVLGQAVIGWPRCHRDPHIL